MTTRSLRYRVATWLLALLFPSQLTSQRPVDTAAVVSAALAAAEQWLALLDKGQLDQGWEQAATALQRTETRAAFAQTLRSARGQFEPFGARRRFTAQYVADVPNAPPGQYVFFQYATSVAGDRQVIETVLAHLDGDRGWRVWQYIVGADPYHRDSITVRRQADSAEARRFLALQQQQARAIREASRRCREPAAEVEAALRRHFGAERAGVQFLQGEFALRALQAIAAGDSNQACVALVDSLATAMARYHE